MRAAARRLRLLPAVPARLHGWPLPWGGQRPAVFHRVRSSGYRAADRKPRAVTFGIRITLYHNIQILAWKILKLARTTPLPRTFSLPSAAPVMINGTKK